ncbi:hypothetical protein P1X14_04380 [Sphingomonas sp. AOB5]|uniref:hypothetical protein n=1 Tax=Sphingomonas sp. AOB5 TaxID=3034017 RepID=UPI0023F94D79|nr:hypothetical protein [Sphingomonas sp. AOB5]MDF7774474.1 hypothetical protein [Sphingomonas sp. AOB5]
MLRVLGLLLIPILFVLPNTASAQVNTKYANHWIVQPAGNCKVVINAGAVYGLVNSHVTKISWSGACGKDGLAEGEGELGIYFTQDGEELYADHIGRFSNGLMQGPWKFATWVRNGDKLSGSGIYNYLAFQDGCMVKFERTEVRSPCRMITGRATAANARVK